MLCVGMRRCKWVGDRWKQKAYIKSQDMGKGFGYSLAMDEKYLGVASDVECIIDPRCQGKVQVFLKSALEK